MTRRTSLGAFMPPSVDTNSQRSDRPAGRKVPRLVSWVTEYSRWRCGPTRPTGRVQQRAEALQHGFGAVHGDAECAPHRAARAVGSYDVPRVHGTHRVRTHVA